MLATPAKLSSILEQLGYKVEASLVHGKNQTRYIHFVVTKNGCKYFCKVNRGDEVFEEHINAGLAKNFGKAPTGIYFMTPAKIEEVKGFSFYFYPYLDQMPVSNESKKFADFNVPAQDIPNYFNKVLKAIEFINQQELITNREYERFNRLESKIFNLAKSIPADVPHGLVFLKYLASEGEGLDKYYLSINDIQPQNMFWVNKDKSLHIFDLEAIGPKLKYYDHAHFTARLWYIHARPEYAKKFLAMTLKSLAKLDQKEAFHYIKFNLIYILLRAYTTYKDEPSRNKIEQMLQWIRKDLLQFVNEL